MTSPIVSMFRHFNLLTFQVNSMELKFKEISMETKTQIDLSVS